MKYKLSVFIFTRDLRLYDNTALITALKNSITVIPIFIFNPKQIDNVNKYKSDNCIQFLCESIDSLSNELKQKESKLYVFYDKPEVIVEKLIKKYNVDGFYMTKDYTPFSYNREKLIQNMCKKYNIQLHLYEDYMLHNVNDVLTQNNEPYVKFTPYYNSAKIKKIRNPISNNHNNYFLLKNIPFEYKKNIHNFYISNNNVLTKGNHKEAHKFLNNTKNFQNYNEEHNMIDIQTTRLSPYLKFGLISIRECYYYLKKHLKPSNNLFKQLHWRDFYMQIMYYNPNVIGFNMNNANIKWENDKMKIKAWKEGKTGVPIVDAGMREMNISGYMHNRCRMIVANFLIKILHVDWRIGERYFANKLVDYDPSNNNGGWQWCASTGTDSQPYFRWFNPYIQSAKYDPDTNYIKKWIPELKNVPSKDIHIWNIKYNEYDVYLEPIVLDLKKEINKTIKIYKKNKN
jgi:deoxyribodipyrimidine photo-lyase